ncbi:3-hydroxyacyl-CoA dehydrogenase/enoyl-CoA hydratase family protein [Rhodospirillaceae bacterium SYSU D60014]|uniref:3-hydroxyacyl-CoA dehydrogenase/enoyl-CoA hydratase family protein n=1 Tax=Virgifigura deserti TaxID=2268457 RepID=UPI000E664BF7
MNEIRKVAVFGAGVMGAGIAAQIANAGVPVMLFDIAAPDGPDRSAMAAAAIKRLLKADPAPLMHKRNAELITPANIDDDIDRIADCDWIVEAIVERVDIKRALYEKIDRARRPGSVVSSNTSTIRLATLIETLPESFARDFLITHFFNPPRYLRLLELVPGSRTGEQALATIERFADLRLGKTPVRCKDRPGFIANRIGIYWLQCAVMQAMDAGLTVEEADAVLGRPMGVPKTGVFGLLDMVGLDLMPHVLGSMATSLPEEDPFHTVYNEPELIKRLIAEGYTGRKGKGGFYRLKPDTPGKVKESLDLASGNYRASRKAALESVAKARRGGLRALLEHPDKGGRYAWWVLSRTLSYAARLVPEIADDIVSVDEAMRLGYNWKYGPFELIDQLGADWFAQKLREAGLPVPPLLAQAEGRRFYRTEAGRLQYLAVDGGYRDVVRPEGVLLLADIKRRKRPLARNRSASLWDIDDGVLCLEFHSKMNSLNPLTLAMVEKAVRLVPGRYRALVIYNEGSNFSVGANIGLLLLAMKLRAWFLVRALVRHGQKTYKRLKYAPFPIVGAPSGMALGGGCEILLHCDAVQAHAETYAGLVEAGVGIVPAWGGCKELLLRRITGKKPPFGPMPPVIKAFETIGMASVAKSAEQAKDLLFLRPGDGITMNRDRLLADAKAKALALAESYVPPETPRVSLPGRTAFAALSLAVDGFRKTGKATPHDVVVGKQLATVLSGGDTDMTETLSEDDLLSLECQAFVALARQPASIARVAHMLKTGKPLRN